MAKSRDHNTQGLDDGDNGGWMNRILADEDNLDRRGLWRLGSWGVGTVGAVVVGILATQSPIAVKRDQLASAQDQAQQLQWIARDSQNKAQQLAAAVETLNSDRDRLYARVTVLEQNVDSVTGSIAKQKEIASLPAIAAAAPAPVAEKAASAAPVQSDAKPLPPAPVISPVASIPAKPSPTDANMQNAKVETPAKDPVVTSALTPTQMPKDTPQAEVNSDAMADKPVQRTAFGVELGGANSIEGLRAVWRASVKTSATYLGGLQPIVVMREGTDGLGMKLRLVAGPLNDAAAAAKICAALIENKRTCETSVYDGQRLALQNDKPSDARASTAKTRARAKPTDPATAPKTSSFSSIFGFR